MGITGMSVPPAFPTAIPLPINANTRSFLINSFRIEPGSPTFITLFVNNNVKVDDIVLYAGLNTLTNLNAQQTIVEREPDSVNLSTFNPTANSVQIATYGTLPSGLIPGQIYTETGIMTLLTRASVQKPLFFTDPAPYDPPTDGSGPLIVTQPVMSVQNPGRAIPDLIIGSMTRVKRVTVTSAQLLDLAHTPLQLLPEPHYVVSGPQGEPGPGLMYSIKNIMFKLNGDGADAYTGGIDTIQITLGPLYNILADPTQLEDLLGTAGGFGSIIPSATLNTESVENASAVENRHLELSAGTALADGDSSLTIVIEYTVLQT